MMNTDNYSANGWNLHGIMPPWGQRQSIYAFLLSHVQPDVPWLSQDADILPDEAPLPPGQFRLAPGLIDGMLAHPEAFADFLEGLSDEEFDTNDGESAGDADMDGPVLASQVISVLRSLLDAPTSAHADELYQLLRQQPATRNIDEVLAALDDLPPELQERVQIVGRWLATCAADREPVKVGIRVLGRAMSELDYHVIMMLGRHEEFTPDVAAALCMSQENPERALWELAKSASNWRRVELVEYLAQTQDQQIKDWLLREGWECAAMLDMHTALPCAVGGDLCAALREPSPDEELLNGACRILSLLLLPPDGVARIKEYPEGAEATLLLLRHLAEREITFQQLLTVDNISSFLQNKHELVNDPLLGWNNYRQEIDIIIMSIYQRPIWHVQVREMLTSEDIYLVDRAKWIAKIVGINIAELSEE